ncbi:MAG: DUF5615 family PIN-like protein [Timaviella obliquedivisa GSE-PSE-MK23-08B]|nr:DUF5615 family PIN-like protein [Timaviella obliquedivisa GSE-PSE-MK23-08B]
MCSKPLSFKRGVGERSISLHWRLNLTPSPFPKRAGEPDFHTFIQQRQIWQYAQQEEFLIVTKDADYSELCLMRGFPPKVVWIRRGNCKTANIESLLRDHYGDLKIMEASISIGILTLF